MASEDPAQLLRDVGLRIGELRRRAGLTQEEAAEKLGVAHRNYQRIELGQQNITLRSLARIAGVLGVRARELLDDPTSRTTKRGRPRKPSPPSE